MTRRLFNKRERLLMAMRQSGKCSACGERLTQGFHADHTVPFSKGGPTLTSNGTAMCSACNLRKGSKMTKKTEMREWQQKALTLATNKFNEGERAFLINAAPGAGKTFAAIVIAKEMLEAGKIDRVIAIAPRTQVVKQWGSEFTQITGLPMDKYTKAQVEDMEDIHDHMVLTWHAVEGMQDILQEVCRHSSTLVIADEIHHAAISRMWGDSTDVALAAAKHIIVLTGTPNRSDGLMPLWAKACESKGAVYEVPYKECVDQGWCVPVTFAIQGGGMDLEMGGHNIRVTDKGVEIPEGLEGIVTKADVNQLAFDKLLKVEMRDSNSLPRLDTAHAEWIREANEKMMEQREREYGEFGFPEGATLVIAPTISMAEYFKELIEMIYPEERVWIVTSDKPGATRKIDKFAKSGDKWLVSVNMVSEGVDIPRLRTMLYMANAKTELHFRQAIGRIIRKSGAYGNPAEDNSRGYCLVPSIPEYREFAKRVEEEMGEVPPPPEPRCPSCKSEGHRPKAGSPCPSCGYEPKPAEPKTWTCSDWTDDGCGTINVGLGKTCRNCGLPRRQPVSLHKTYKQRHGVLARGIEMSEKEALEAEAEVMDTINTWGRMSDRDKELLNKWPQEVLARMHYALTRKQKEA